MGIIVYQWCVAHYKVPSGRYTGIPVNPEFVYHLDMWRAIIGLVDPSDELATFSGMRSSGYQNFLVLFSSGCLCFNALSYKSGLHLFGD